MLSERSGLIQNKIPGIQSFRHVHDGHPALGIPGINGSLDAGGPTMPRQKRSMHINAGQFCNSQKPPRENLSIGHHHNEVRLQSRDLCQSLFLAHSFRLQDRHTGIQCQLLDARGPQFRTAPNSSIWLGHQPNQMPSPHHHLKGRQRDLSRPHE